MTYLTLSRKRIITHFESLQYIDRSVQLSHCRTRLRQRPQNVRQEIFRNYYDKWSLVDVSVPFSKADCIEKMCKLNLLIRLIDWSRSLLLLERLIWQCHLMTIFKLIVAQHPPMMCSRISCVCSRTSIFGHPCRSIYYFKDTVLERTVKSIQMIRKNIRLFWAATDMKRFSKAEGKQPLRMT